jgi:DNA (cytosine-5)-methyltransferase 1
MNEALTHQASQPTAPAANDQDELIIDLFAGGGGASTGILMATGRHPDLAVNHNQQSVDLHRANHPTTLHLCEDIRQVDPVAVLTRNWPGRKVGLMWASPDCRHHSKASGGALKDRGVRGLAWEVVRWAVAIRKATGSFPKVIALENVEEFADWGPVHRYGPKAGKVQKRRRGETFKLWRQTFEGLGAIVEKRELVAADYGAPTTRKRLFVVISWAGPIAWPQPTHAKAGAGGLHPWLSAASIIEWSRPCPSIFHRKKALAPKTHRRIAKGIKRFVIDAARPFIVPLTHAGDDRIYDPAQPLPTITAANRGELAAVAPHLTEIANWSRDGDRSIETPLPTVTAKPDGGSFAMVAAHLLRTDMHKSNAGCFHDATAPLNTVTSTGGFAVATAFLGRQFGSTVSGRSLEDPAPTVMSGRGGGGKSQLVAPILDKYYETGVAQAVDRPLDSVTTKGRFGLNAAFLEQANTGMVGHDVRTPMSTIVGGGAHSGWGTTQRLIEAQLQAMGAPAGSKRRAVLKFLWEHFGEPTAEEWADPLATAQGRLRFGLVVIEETCWQIVDIGMRMLAPRELFGAQGFPADYIIDVTWEGVPLTKTAQIRNAGNSVSPPVAAALLRSILPDRALRQEAA